MTAKIEKSKVVRVKTTDSVEAEVLLKSARRCPLCYYLNGDLNEQHGQIAHLDQNRANSAQENLAFMCMPHHSLYDSRTSQHKNYTLAEIMAMRDVLYLAIKDKKHHAKQQQSKLTSNESALKHDIKIFEAALKTLSENELFGFLDDLMGGHNFYASNLSKVMSLIHYLDSPNNEYLDSEILEASDSFKESLDSLLEWCVTNFYIYPESQISKTGEHVDLKSCLWPDGNMDRSLHPSKEDMKHYDALAKKMYELIAKCREMYRSYRRMVKTKLYV
jgi:hypothetical protein